MIKNPSFRVLVRAKVQTLDEAIDLLDRWQWLESLRDKDDKIIGGELSFI